MAQFDIYTNNNPDSTVEFLYLLDIQADILSSLETRVVIPLRKNIKAIQHLNPEFIIGSTSYILLTQELAGVHKSALDEKSSSLKEHRSEIIATLDFMVSGF
ncbi:MAG: CcdB family protein [Sulfuricurvum sp.]|uniref:CcdB family protein n=1 Tax=Sulfuricurvum sp. TaxID=2025608 RepID=UPI0025EE658C|nr:CcdB family protein [Sulfuricurvum sp.]MBV5320762.1 CcdB family protein [Sulfuricurvum sp.]